MIKKRRGFTLVELLIVMAVIAILIGIAIPAFRGMQQEARKTKAEGDVRVLKIAVESYYKNNGKYPFPNATACKTFNISWENLLTGATPKILEAVLNDPFSSGASSQYSYALSSDTQTSANYYVILSVGMDATRDITGINNTSGSPEGSVDDDIYETNGIRQ